jgi:hypothetical protein
LADVHIQYPVIKVKSGQSAAFILTPVPTILYDLL